MKNRVSSAVEKRGKLCEENDWPLREKTGIAVNDPGHFFEPGGGKSRRVFYHHDHGRFLSNLLE
jgi:hypothetical protein